MVSRIGGDEFAIVLHAVDAEGMDQLAGRVLTPSGRRARGCQASSPAFD